MDAKNFNLVMIASICIYLILGLVFIAIKADSSLILFTGTLILFMFGCMFVAKITHGEKSFGVFYCIILNFFINPLFFFIIGDYFNGAAIFFPLGIIVTVFVLSKKKYTPYLVALELIWYVITVFFVYFNQDSFIKYRQLVNPIESNTVCFLLVAIAIMFLCIYQTFIYMIARGKLDDANRDISLAESSRIRFLANMTHEIRTPMNAIIGMTNLILKEELSQEARDQVNVINKASSDLLRIINDILEFSKLDSGKVELFNTEYSFKALLSDLIFSVTSEYEKDNISLHVVAKKGIPDVLFGDNIRIRQIFRYILFSSLSQSAYGTVLLNLDYDIDDDEKTVTISGKVAATGEGFSKSELDSMFNAYSNYDSRQRSSYKGTGLELNICRLMLKMMGGDLSVESIEGIGSSVKFSFVNYIVDEKPIAKKPEGICKPLIYISDYKYERAWQELMGDFEISAAYARNKSSFKNALEEIRFTHIFIPSGAYDDLRDIIESAECSDITYIIGSQDNVFGDFGKCRILRHPVYSINLAEALNNTWNEEDYHKKENELKYTYPDARVLLVDDSVINLKVEESLLAAYSINPRFATGGKEALDILKREDFDLVLLDQRMPEFDGIDTIHALRNSDYLTKDIPVICVTAEFGSDTKDRLVKEGFNDYLAKPINLRYLDKVIKEYIPKELAVVVDVEAKTKAENVSNGVGVQDNVDTVDVLSFTPDEGIKNLGGSVEAYIAVLQSYYSEGVEKLTSVPEQLASGDISLYTTNVHALKSSSATVGAMGISPLFKALEFAGKENNLEFINDNSEKTFNYFVDVLEKVKEYLIENDAFIEEEEVVEDSEEDNEGDVTPLDFDLLQELNTSISSMNLRRCEEILDELSQVNYGKEINAKIKSMKNSYDNFEYMEIKEVLNTLIG